MGSETLTKNVLCWQHKQVLLGPSFPSLPGAPTRKRTAESSNIFERNIKSLCSSILAELTLAFALILAVCAK